MCLHVFRAQCLCVKMALRPNALAPRCLALKCRVPVETIHEYYIVPVFYLYDNLVIHSRAIPLYFRSK